MSVRRQFLKTCAAVAVAPTLAGPIEPATQVLSAEQAFVRPWIDVSLPVLMTRIANRQLSNAYRCADLKATVAICVDHTSLSEALSKA